MSRRRDLKRGAIGTKVFNCGDCGKLIRRNRVGSGLCKPCAARRNAKLSAGPERQGREIACEVCGTAVYVTPGQLGRRRFCSARCMGVASRKTRTCKVCGEELRAGATRRTCSSRCANKAKSRSKTGGRNPNFRAGERRAQQTWRASIGQECACCGSGSRLHLHHVVYEQHVRRLGGDPFEPRNGLTLCFECHMGHHHNVDRQVRIELLRPENAAFAFDLMGAAAADYFCRYYEQGCMTLGRLLEIAAEYEATGEVSLDVDSPMEMAA